MAFVFNPFTGTLDHKLVVEGTSSEITGNITLNDNYISNDGDDEGISISDAGLVGYTAIIPDGVSFGGHLVQTSYGNTSTAILVNNHNRLLITGAVASGQTVYGTGLDIDVTAQAASGSTSGTISLTGLDVDVVGETDGTQTATGLDATAQGADTNYGAQITSSDRQLRLRYDGSSYLDITVANDSHTTIANAESGNFTLDAAGDITLDAGGADINFNVAGTSYLSWSAIGNLKMMNASDTGDYFNINVGANAVTTMTTVDDSGAKDAKIVFQPQGDVIFTPAANKDLKATITTKTASSSLDSSFSISETLNLSSGAGGSDVHYGLWYDQTQTNLAGWDSVYLMVLDGGSGKLTYVNSDGELFLSSSRKLYLGASHEYIYGDQTDIHIGVGSGGDINIPANIGLTFGDDGEKIEGNGTKLTIASSDDLDLTVTDVVLTAQTTKIEWGGTGSGEHIVGAGTNELTIAAGNDINLTAANDINIPASVGLTFGADTEKIEADGSNNLEIDAAGGITLDAEGAIILNSESGSITVADGLGAYTPANAASVTTKAYVDANQYHFIRVGFFNSGTAKMYMPLPGSEDMREITSPVGAGERVSFICPFDGSLETVWGRSEYDAGDVEIGLHVATAALEVPSATATQTVTVDMGTDDTSYEFDFASAGTNTFSQGNILMFSVTPTSQLGDCHFMIVLKFDVST